MSKELLIFPLSFLSSFSSIAAIFHTLTHLPPSLLTVLVTTLPVTAPSSHWTTLPCCLLSAVSSPLIFSHTIFSQSVHSRKTFSDSLSCKLGCLSSLISKNVSLPLLLLYLPIQPTLSLNQASSLCVKNTKTAVHISELNWII